MFCKRDLVSPKRHCYCLFHRETRREKRRERRWKARKEKEENFLHLLLVSASPQWKKIEVSEWEREWDWRRKILTPIPSLFFFCSVCFLREGDENHRKIFILRLMKVMSKIVVVYPLSYIDWGGYCTCVFILPKKKEKNNKKI